jgi:AbrB family looped-hinge helix DNA binding protein
MNATSKLTAQAQVSVPAAVRRKLGLGPGSVLAWEEDGDRVVVRRVGRHSSVEIHETVFVRTPQRRSAAQIRSGIRAYVRKRHARG